MIFVIRHKTHGFYAFGRWAPERPDAEEFNSREKATKALMEHAKRHPIDWAFISIELDDLTCAS